MVKMFKKKKLLNLVVHCPLRTPGAYFLICEGQYTCTNTCILLSALAYHKSNGKEDMLPPPLLPCVLGAGTA